MPTLSPVGPVSGHFVPHCQLKFSLCDGQSALNDFGCSQNTGLRHHVSHFHCEVMDFRVLVGKPVDATHYLTHLFEIFRAWSLRGGML